MVGAPAAGAAEAPAEEAAPVPAAPLAGPFTPPVTVPLPDPLTPEGLAHMYQSLTVTYRDRDEGTRAQVTCSPSIYLNGLIRNREPNIDAINNVHRCAGRAAMGRNPIIAFADGHNQIIGRCRQTRGTPGDFAYIISLALSAGVIGLGRVDQFCKNRAVCGLGLDCVGFVRSYFRLRYDFDADSSIPNYRRGPQRRTVAEIQPDDVLVWNASDGGSQGAHSHIAVVSSRVSGAATRFRIGESTGSFGGPPGRQYGRGGGVAITTYEFGAPDSRGSFPVRRNIDDRPIENNVSVYGVDR